MARLVCIKCGSVSITSVSRSLSQAGWRVLDMKNDDLPEATCPDCLQQERIKKKAQSIKDKFDDISKKLKISERQRDEAIEILTKMTNIMSFVLEEVKPTGLIKSSIKKLELRLSALTLDIGGSVECL